jgi:hypothetical protein
VHKPPRKIRARFGGYKHTSLVFSVGKPSGVGFFSAQKTTVVTLGRRGCCRVALWQKRQGNNRGEEQVE